MASQARSAKDRRSELEEQRRQLEFDDLLRRGFSALDRSPLAKSIGGNVAGAIAMPVGVGRGVVHDVQGIADGVRFVGGVVSSPTARASAVRAVQRKVDDGAAYVKSRAANPQLMADDLARVGTRWNKDLNPAATPSSASFADEVARRYRIGLNDGEAAYNVGAVLLPAVGEVKGAFELGRFAAPGPAKYVKMGATPGQAAYLAEREYRTIGHHSIAPRRAKTVAQLPVIKKTAERLGVPQVADQVFGQIPVPRLFTDSAFSVVNPRGVERGQAYRRHYGLDDYYYGGRVPAEHGGGGWSGRKLGWTKYGPVERLWYGTPGATKAAGIGSLASLDAIGRTTSDEDMGW